MIGNPHDRAPPPRGHPAAGSGVLAGMAASAIAAAAEERVAEQALELMVIKEVTRLLEVPCYIAFSDEEHNFRWVCNLSLG